MNWLMAALFSFVLFLVLFPLFGLLLGLLARVVLPYTLAGMAAAVVLAARGTLFSSWWLLILPATLWAFLVIWERIAGERRGWEKLPWHDGHYRAALRVVTLGRLGAGAGQESPIENARLRAEKA